MENKAIMKRFFYIISNKEKETLIVVDKTSNVTPPNVSEVQGFTKSVFYKDWEIDSYGGQREKKDS